MTGCDIAIIGGGIIGSATAYFLLSKGFTGSVAIIEQDTSYQFGATGRSLGGIRQQFSAVENIELSKFTLALLRQLKEKFGPEADVSFFENGYLLLASERGTNILQENHHLQIRHGADNILLDAEALAIKFPWLSPEGISLGCYGLTGEGWLDPYRLMDLFRKQAVALGAQIIKQKLIGFKRDGDQIVAVKLGNGETLICRQVINAAGAAAGHIASLAGLELPVEPRKRYVYLFDCPEASEALHKAPLTVSPIGAYFRPEGRFFLCGLSPEQEQEPLPEGWEVDYDWFETNLWPELARFVPAFETLKVSNGWVGYYDYNRFDQNAIVGPHPVIKNFYFANGFSGHGLQQGAGVGHALAELILYGAYRTIDLSRFSYDRILTNRPFYERNVI